MTQLTVSSPAFRSDGAIPAKYTCDGDGISPPLEIKGIPEETKTLALLVEDPDAPSGTFLHWIVWNIPATSKIGENQIPGVEGLNDSGRHSYHPPCPPSGTHRYVFKVYALDTRIDLSQSAGKEEVDRAMKGHIVAKGELVGRYKRR